MYKLLLKSIRTEAHMTQGQLAKLLGVDIKTVGNWERGRTALNLDDACAICDVLHCTPNDLCGWYLSHPEDRPKAQPPGLTHEESLLVDRYRSLDRRRRDSVYDTVDALADKAQAQEECSGASSEGAA